MSESGPIIEELPDDYEDLGSYPTSAHAASASSSSAPPKKVNSASAANSDGGAGLRKGFFNRTPARGIAKTVEAANPVEFSAPAAASRESAKSAEKEDEPFVPRPDVSEGPEGDISSLLDSLRARLQNASISVAEQPEIGQDEFESLRELRELLSSSVSSQSRWPTTQVRNALSKSSLEANTALAEMRAASNDARRMRSGDEKKALAELRRVIDDVLERVRKVVEISAPKAISEEDKQHATVAAFHVLPFTAKLRILADERTALAIFAACFSAGAVLVLGIMVEVYSAWGCGHRCGSS
jgi:hypothetical protein